MLNFTKQFIFRYLLLLFSFIFCLYIVCLIPSGWLKSNINNSLITFSQEGTYPSYGLPFRKIVLDNFTDPLMFNIAYSINHQNPLRSALATVYSVGTKDNTNEISNLKELIINSPTQPVDYERYWHGYLIYLRPLLIFFTYPQIRLILMALLWSELFVFLYVIYRQTNLKTILFFVAGFIATDVFYLGQSLQFSPVFLIGLSASIYFLLAKHKTNPFWLLFVVGGLTSFFDLLTAPLVSLEIVLLTILLISPKRSFLATISLCFSWAIGYLSLWFSKWLITFLLYVPTAITTSFSEIINRTVTPADANFSQLAAIKLNIFQLIGYDKTNKYFILAFAVLCLILFILRHRYIYLKLQKSLLWLMIALIPIFWYYIAANHSYIHVWYTYRNLFISVVAGFLSLNELINWPLNKSEKPAKPTLKSH